MTSRAIADRPDARGKTGFRRMGWLAAGHAAFLEGLVGAFLPVLPTTGFWILAAFCFARSSPDLYRRILEDPRFGATVRDLVERGIVSRRAKTLALCGMSAGAGALALSPAPAIAQVAGLAAIAASALFVATRRETAA